MTQRLPLRQFEATDPHALREWLAGVRASAGSEEAYDEVVASVIGQIGREYQRVAAALKAKGRGQRQGGSEALDKQQTIAWAELAEERVRDGEAESDSTDASEATDASSGGSANTPAAEPKRGKRAAFPASWHRERVEVPVSEDQRTCSVCGKDKVCIGHEVSEVLAIIPAQLFVKQYFREKLACSEEHDGVITAPPEPRLVERSACDLSLSLDLLDRKLVQHLPIYRIQQIYERLGCSVAEATLNRWYHDGLRSLAPVARVLRVLTTAIERFLLNIDDTTIPILDRDHDGGTQVGHIWIVVGDGLFVSATASRDWTKEHPQQLIGDWAGYVQADAYRGFDGIFKKGVAIEVGCWAHARRYFVKARDRGDKLADEALGLIGRLYKVEADAKGLAPEARQAMRQERSRPVIDLLWKWITKVQQQKPTRPKSPLGKAFRYLTNQRQALERYLDDGRLLIDNTVVEREMKPIILGRKNWLFAGSFDAAERLADGITVIASARMHGVDPVAYLGWLLPQLARRAWSDEQIAARLLPASFKQALEQAGERGVGDGEFHTEAL